MWGGYSQQISRGTELRRDPALLSEGHLSAPLSRSWPRSMQGTPAMLSTHTDGHRCRGLKGSCRQEEEEKEKEEGREGAALPLRTAAAHCSRRQAAGPRSRLAPTALSGMLSRTGGGHSPAWVP